MIAVVVSKATPLAIGPYLLGAAGAVVAAAALAFGAVRVRRAMLPAWRGPEAYLADALLAVAALIFTAQAMGSVHAFSRGPMLIAYVVVGGAMAAVGTGVRPSTDRRAPGVTDRARRPVETGFAIGALLVVGAQWFAHVAFALTSGMTQPDTLWYHAPFAVRFVQEHQFTGLSALGYPTARYFPLNAEMVHAIAMLPFRRDVLSPLVNLGWAALTVLAAWCIGRRRGVGALSVLGIALVLGLPVLSGVEPGQASNDLPCAALALASVALLLIGELSIPSIVLAGVAAALSMGTKLTAAGIIGTLTIGIIVIAVQRRRAAIAVAWCVPLLASGYWFVRDWVALSNPLPWFSFHLGPISFDRSFDEGGTSLVSLWRKPGLVRHLYIPGLPQGYGVLWPLLIVAFVVAVVVLIVRPRAPIERVVGIAVLVGAITYFFTPLTGGPGFVFNLRYIAPAFVIGFSTLPALLAGAPTRTRATVAGAVFAIVALDVAVAPGTQLPAWPTNNSWLGVVAVIAVGASIAAIVVLRRRTSLSPLAITAGAVALAVVVGFPVQHRFLNKRYVAAGLTQDVAYSYFRDVHHARVAVFGTLTYPIFGTDLTNRADQVNAAGSGAAVDRCRATLRMLGHRYDYVVLTPTSGFLTGTSVPEKWFAAATTPVAQHRGVVVLRIARPLDANTCT